MNSSNHATRLHHNNQRINRRPIPWDASSLTLRFASKIVEGAKGAPILDVACGSGRNAFLLAELGGNVVCIDNDLTRIKAQLALQNEVATCRLQVRGMDLVSDPWPFGRASVGGIVNVHFLLHSLFLSFADSLKPGGYLLLETAPGCGNNYLELPQAGIVKSGLAAAFDFEFYKEKKVGPPSSNAVTVKLLARRR